MMERKSLCDICIPLRKEIIKQGDLKDDGKYPVVNSGVTLYGYYNAYNNDGNAFTLASRGEYAGFVTYLQDKFWAGGLCYPYRSKDESLYSTKYIYEYLKNRERYIMDTLVMRGGIPALNKADVDKIQISLPTLSEQTRIVDILDTFTVSIENLKQQITQRRKQYEYYRDQLLDLEGKEGVEMKTIKDVFDTRNGYTPSTSNELFWNDGIIPWFKMEDIRDNGRILSDSYLHITPQAIKGKGLFKANTIILATSATIGEHALILVDFLCNQRFTNFSLKKNYVQCVDMKYIYYYMFVIDEWCKQHINQGGFASVDMTGLYNLNIPLPPLSDQQRIVSILDTFEASIQNLEAQLEQREKQYEYYRNKLLTFE